MIHEVDEALRTLVEREALGGSGVEVSFDAPTKAWAAARTAPVVNVYLFEIREDTERRAIQFLYRDPDGFHFMDSADFNQFSFPVDDLAEQIPFMTENMEGIEALVVDDEVIAIELPDTVEMTIVETAPGVRGNSATGRTKPATLTTGHIVQVPEHLEQGVVVRVDTRTGEYLGRAN